MLRLGAILALGMAMLCFPAATSKLYANELRVVSWGGVLQRSQREGFFKPFAEQNGVKLVEEEWAGEIAKVRAMVQSKNVTWDVVDVETAAGIQGCDENVLEKIDWTVVGDRNNFLPGLANDCAVGHFVFAYIYAYDASRIIGEKKPTTIADFFDTKTWPGKRGLRKRPQSTLEFALLGDGVPPDQVYKLLATKEGVDRAFKKLESIKNDIIWWSPSAAGAQLLADGQVLMTFSSNGRIYDAVKNHGKNFVIVWHNQQFDADWWAIPKGSPNKDLAMKFLAFASKPEQNVQLSKYMPYGPTVKAAVPLIDKSIADHLPTKPEHMKSALQVNSTFWADHNDELSARFQAWLAQ